jgi:hypothetical protein
MPALNPPWGDDPPATYALESQGLQLAPAA